MLAYVIVGRFVVYEKTAVTIKLYAATQFFQQKLNIYLHICLFNEDNLLCIHRCHQVLFKSW